MLEPGENCWRIERADRAALVVDAADYYRHARQAMLKAKSQILLIGWDFDTRICLDFEADDDAPNELGAFLTWLQKTRDDLQIYILKWDVGALHLLGRGTTVLRLIRWASSEQIHFKLDGAHPPGASHHQKIVVIDDALAFCGGIDMTASRWDTRDHRDGDLHRRRPTTHRRYPPWHDATMGVSGRAAAAIGELGRKRWKIAGGDPIPAPKLTNDCWPDDLVPQFEDVDVAIARTRAEYDDHEAIREIEALFIDMIEGAKHHVYVENQYFASRAIAEAICKRLGEDDGPEFVIVNPRTGQGWLDDEVMSPARAELHAQLHKADRHGRFRFYTPVTADGDDIYVHSKIMIVDDRQLRIGSANMNNRSLGFDSECDLMIDTALSSNRDEGESIKALRADLMAEHLGVSADAVAARIDELGSLIATIDTLSTGSGRALERFIPEEPNKVEKHIAKTEMLDPESAGEDFEPMARPGLLGRFPSILRGRHSRPAMQKGA